MSQIDKQKIMKNLEAWKRTYSEMGFQQHEFAINGVIKRLTDGEYDSDIDYQQRYESLVQALRDGYSDSETAAGLIAWVESTTGIELWEDDSNEVATD